MKTLLYTALAALTLTGCDDALVIRVPAGGDLVRARDEARAARANGESRPVVIALEGGRYELREAVQLDGRDSGVAWCAAPGTEVRVSGGRLVTSDPEPVADAEILGLLPEKARQAVVQYDLQKLGIEDWGDCLYNHEDAVQRRVAKTWGQGEFTMGSHPPPKDSVSAGRMELFVDDRPMTVARSATGVVYHVDKLLGQVVRSGPGKGYECSPEGLFTYRETLPAGWTKEPDPHVCGCWCHDWAEQHQRIEKLDPGMRRMELSRPYHQYKYRSGSYFFGVNMLCELDEPGEWYVHRKSGKLVAWMPEGGKRRVELSMSSRLFELEGATNVVLRGLVLEACRNSAVRMSKCEGCRLEDCTVRNLGQHALIVEDGHACGARRCEFHGMGGGGVWLVDDNRKTLAFSDHFVEACDIHDFGRWNRMYRPGVCLAGVGMRAEGNRIHDAPHAAVLYFGCELLMRSNEVFRVCSESKDCGAFYTGRSWLLRGNRIVDNRVHDIIGLGGAFTRTIYLDDSVAQVEVSGNRFERCTWGIFLGGGRENVITNNVFVDCPGALYVDRRGMNWQRKHVDGRLKELAERGTLYGIPCKEGPYVERYPAIRDLPGPRPYEPVLNVISGNRFVRGKAEWIRRYAPAMATDPRWWRAGEVKDDQLEELGVFRDNAVDNAGL